MSNKRELSEREQAIYQQGFEDGQRRPPPINEEFSWTEVHENNGKPAELGNMKKIATILGMAVVRTRPEAIDTHP